MNIAESLEPFDPAARRRASVFTCESGPKVRLEAIDEAADVKDVDFDPWPIGCPDDAQATGIVETVGAETADGTGTATAKDVSALFGYDTKPLGSLKLKRDELNGDAWDGAEDENDPRPV